MRSDNRNNQANGIRPNEIWIGRGTAVVGAGVDVGGGISDP